MQTESKHINVLIIMCVYVSHVISAENVDCHVIADNAKSVIADNAKWCASNNVSIF